MSKAMRRIQARFEELHRGLQHARYRAQQSEQAASRALDHARSAEQALRGALAVIDKRIRFRTRHNPQSDRMGVILDVDVDVLEAAGHDLDMLLQEAAKMAAATLVRDWRRARSPVETRSS